MRYRDYEGPVEELVRQKLEEIQEKEHVRVIHGVESGSRAWGFASPDSDYDVRFVYVRPLEYYLGLQPKADTLEWELDETLDINGWDLSKVLQHFHKSNATLFEWSQSPVVYRTTADWEAVRAVARDYFSCKSAMCHYYGTAKKNYMEYLTGERVRYKKYFYVLRPLLACRWIEKKASPPPVLFRDLCREVLEEEMRPAVEKLLAEKMRMSEGEEGARIDRVNEYILRELNYYKEKTEQMADDRNADWEALNVLFRSLLGVK
jgi:hypothetical protein